MRCVIEYLGVFFNKSIFPYIGFLIINIRWSCDCFIFMIGIILLVKWHLYIEPTLGLFLCSINFTMKDVRQSQQGQNVEWKNVASIYIHWFKSIIIGILEWESHITWQMSNSWSDFISSQEWARPTVFASAESGEDPMYSCWSNFFFHSGLFQDKGHFMYHKTSNTSRTLVGNKIVDHSDVVEALPVCAAPPTSSFSTWHLASRDSAKKSARQYENLVSFGIWCTLY